MRSDAAEKRKKAMAEEETMEPLAAFKEFMRGSERVKSVV